MRTARRAVSRRAREAVRQQPVGSRGKAEKEGPVKREEWVNRRCKSSTSGPGEATVSDDDDDDEDEVV